MMVASDSFSLVASGGSWSLNTSHASCDGECSCLSVLPFGEELGAGVGGRTTSQGYSQPGGIRQGFTGLEKDGETGLNFAQSRYYSPAMGRFTSPDEPRMDQWQGNPQSWNLYSYVRNNPLRLVDPLGGRAQDPKKQDDPCPECDDPENIETVFIDLCASCGDVVIEEQVVIQGEYPPNTLYFNPYVDRHFNDSWVGIDVWWAARMVGAGDPTFYMNPTRGATGVLNAARAGISVTQISAIAQTTIEAVVASASRARNIHITEGARAIDKKIGHALAGGYKSAFDGVPATQANADSLIKSILSNPSRVVPGGKVVDVYNAAGQGVRYEAGTGRFMGFLEASRATR